MKLIMKPASQIISYSQLTRINETSCEFCEKTFPNMYKEIIHNAAHIIIPLRKLQVFQCQHCLHHFTSENKLLKHVATAHPTSVKIEKVDIESSLRKPTREHVKEELKWELPKKPNINIYEYRNHKIKLINVVNYPNIGNIISCSDADSALKNKDEMILSSISYPNVKNDVSNKNKMKLDNSIPSIDLTNQPEDKVQYKVIKDTLIRNIQNNINSHPIIDLTGEDKTKLNNVIKYPITEIPIENKIQLHNCISISNTELTNRNNIQTQNSHPNVDVTKKDEIKLNNIANLESVPQHLELSNIDLPPSESKMQLDRFTSFPNMELLDDMEWCDDDFDAEVNLKVREGCLSYHSAGKKIKRTSRPFDPPWLRASRYKRQRPYDTSHIDLAEVVTNNNVNLDPYDCHFETFGSFKSSEINKPYFKTNPYLINDNRDKVVPFCYLMQRGIHKCPHCPRRFINRFTCIQHEMDHINFNKPPIMLCRICDRYIAGNRRNLTEHRRLKHPYIKSLGGHKLKCKKCNLPFQHYSRHVRYYHSLECFICSTEFKDMVMYQTHMSDHRSQLTYIQACDLCLAFFKTKINIKYILIGVKYQPGIRLECNECGKMFPEVNIIERWSKRYLDREAEEKVRMCVNEVRLKNIQQRLKLMKK